VLLQSKILKLFINRRYFTVYAAGGICHGSTLTSC